MDVTEVIIRPLITEKSHILKTSENPKLAFIVNKQANKHQIKQAFYLIFSIKPISINTILRKPQKTRIMKFSRKNYTSMQKIAYITIDKKDFENLKNISEQPDIK